MTTASELANRWNAEWPAALAAWSPYTLLRPPIYFEQEQEANASRMAGQIAAIRLTDQAIMVNLATIRKLGLENHALAILAHEIGHHVYVPGNLADNARMLAAMQPMLLGLSPETPAFVANLYGDLHLNDRLQRRHGVDVASVYLRLRETIPTGESTDTWKVYTRAYEHLWRLSAGTLSPPNVTAEMNADALLIARLIRHFSTRWLSGARRFAAILFPHLHADQQKPQTFVKFGLGDCKECCRGAIPDGLAAIDPLELGEGDDFDAAIDGLDRESMSRRRGTKTNAPATEQKASPGSQHRAPFEYGELLKALGLDLSQHEITTRYYRERALPHLLPFPVRKQPQSTEPLMEGYESWDAGDDLQELDLLGSIMRSPVIVPGVTTVRRVYGAVPGADPSRTPVDLDIYVDCSGSMPNPAINVSYLALCGAILVLSALRAGARIQATLWSGPGQFETTAGFIRDEKRLLGVVTGFISGSTAFPLHVLRDTYATRTKDARAVHIVVISDDGVDTILQKDEKGTPGSELCRLALERARGGGTLVLNLANPEQWNPQSTLQELGFAVHAVQDWEQLVAFARQFVRENYQ